MVATLMMSTKLATLGLFKLNLFRNKAFGVLISVLDVTNKILSRDLIHIKGLTKKYNIFEWCSWFKFNNLGLAPRYCIEILQQCGKRVKTKSQKVLETNFYVCRSYRRKPGRGLFWPSSWIGLKSVLWIREKCLSLKMLGSRYLCVLNSSF